MARYTYRPMEEAPKDGTPIIAVCGGVEMAVIWDGEILNDWSYFDEDDGGCLFERASDTRGWRKMF
jgi:hypothetical protein